MIYTFDSDTLIFFFKKWFVCGYFWHIIVIIYSLFIQYPLQSNNTYIFILLLNMYILIYPMLFLVSFVMNIYFINLLKIRISFILSISSYYFAILFIYLWFHLYQFLPSLNWSIYFTSLFYKWVLNSF